MYNEKIKQTYIALLPNQTAQDKVLRFFKTVQYQEEIRNKDVGQMGKEELIQTLRYTIGIQYATRESIQRSVNIVKKYQKWFYVSYLNKLQDKYPSESIKAADIDDIEIYPYKFCKNGTELLELLKMVFDVQWTRQMCCVVTYLLLFNGVPFKSVIFLNKGDIDFENKVISFSKNSVKYQVSMLPEFVDFYSQVHQIDTYKGKVNILLNPTKYIPIVKCSNVWYSHFQREVGDILENKKSLLEKNFLVKKPVNIDNKIIALNGWLYRTYLSENTPKNYLTALDSKDKHFKTYNKFVQVFYSESERRLSSLSEA